MRTAYFMARARVTASIEAYHAGWVYLMYGCFQALSLAAAIDRDCAALLAPHGLSEGRFVLLFLLDAAPGGLAPAVLAQQAGVSRATVTGLIDGLEREALVARQADASDRRALRIFNVTMAALLVLSLYPLVIHLLPQ